MNKRGTAIQNKICFIVSRYMILQHRQGAVQRCPEQLVIGWSISPLQNKTFILIASHKLMLMCNLNVVP